MDFFIKNIFMCKLWQLMRETTLCFALSIFSLSLRFQESGNWCGLLKNNNNKQANNCELLLEFPFQN